MASPNTKQQSSNLKKLLLIAGGLIVIVVVAFPSSDPGPVGPKKGFVFGAGDAVAKKKVDPLDLPEDHKVKFESIGASIKNGFVPLVTKGDGKLRSKEGIPTSWANGEGSWTYTGNMTVDGVPNALLENGTSGDGVFLRPGQRWKNLRLIAVKEDSIVIEGPNNERKTIRFDDKGTSVALVPSAMQPLPPASIQGNLPQGVNPQINQPGVNPRRQRRQEANQANADAISGPIGGQSDLESSVDDSVQTNNSNISGKNRRIGRNQ